MICPSMLQIGMPATPPVWAVSTTATGAVPLAGLVPIDSGRTSIGVVTLSMPPALRAVWRSVKVPPAA